MEYPPERSRRPRKLAVSMEMLHLPPILFVLLAATGFTAAAIHAIPPMEVLGRFLGSLAFTQIAISIHNDCCDRVLDASAKPWRALPSGLVSQRVAMACCIGCLTLGLALALTLDVRVAGLVAVGTAMGLLYNWRLKRTIWTWLPFWLGLPTLAVCSFVVMGRFRPQLWEVYLIGAPLVLAIYLADTLSDIDADTSLGVAGLAHQLGTRQAYLTCWTALAMAGLLTATLTSLDFGSIAADVLAALLLLLAIGVVKMDRPRWHWFLIICSATVLSVGWLFNLATGA